MIQVFSNSKGSQHKFFPTSEQLFLETKEAEETDQGAKILFHNTYFEPKMCS